MYRHILVPLDGSHLAEQVLPHAKALASLDPGARLTLLRAVPPIYPTTIEYSGVFTVTNDTLPAIEREAQEYLNTIATELQKEGLNVKAEVSIMPAAEAIIDYAENHRADLIAIATHGRSGISRWVFGSVTQKVIQATSTPMLVIHPQE